MPPSPTKSAFIRDHLQEHPGAKEQDVVEAWQAAGHTGKLSGSMYFAIKKSLGLTGKAAARPKAAKSQMTARSEPTTPAVSAPQNKSTFAQAFRRQNPTANFAALNEAWQATGQEDTISESLFHKSKSAVGKQSKKPALALRPKPAVEVEAPSNGMKENKVTPAKAPSAVLAEMEKELDRLMFQIIGQAELRDVEEALRQVRRLVIRKHEG